MAAPPACDDVEAGRSAAGRAAVGACAGGPTPPKGDLAKGGLLRDPVKLGGLSALAGVAVTMLCGVLLQYGFHLNRDSTGSKLTPCLLETAGYDPAIALKGWDWASPQWLACSTFLGIYCLRQYLLRFMANRFYGELPEGRRVKVANYMLELLGTTLALMVGWYAGYYQLLFRPGEMEHPTPQEAHDLAVAAQVMFGVWVGMYVLELSFDQEARMGLVLHHMTTCLLLVWGFAVISVMGPDVMLLRCNFAVSLYMSTEQNVFLQMLLYYKRVYLPVTYYASVALYIVTRVAVCALSLWTWWQFYDRVFQRDLADSWVVYSYWLFLPLVNVVLNLTQLTTIQSLLGIAGSVRRRCREAGSEKAGAAAAGAVEAGGARQSLGQEEPQGE